MKQKSEQQIRTSKVLTYVLLGLISVLGLVCLYYGSTSAPGLRRSDDESSGFDGSDPVLGTFGRNRDFDDLFEDQELNPEVPKSIPVSNVISKSLIFFFVDCLWRLIRVDYYYYFIFYKLNSLVEWKFNIVCYLYRFVI